MKTYKDVDSYIASFPKDEQGLLIALRELIHKAVPKAVESISYGMPAYKLNGKPVAYFGRMKTHLGFYPTPGPIVAFKKELSIYKQSKGAVQLPADKPLPVGLVTKMLKYRVAQIKELTQ